MKKRLYHIAALLCIAAGTYSCTFLDEDPSHIGTAETTYTTPEGLELALNGCYSSLRDIHEDKTLWLDGTDLFGRDGIPMSQNYTSTDFNAYSTQAHTSDNKVFENFWNRCFKGVNRANIVLNQCKDIDMDSTLKATRLAEAATLRALYYYYLVEQFGDVPLRLLHTEQIETTAERTPEKEIYAQIITDVEQAAACLEWTPDKFGRIGKGAAYFLLSKLHLTRGYKPYAQSDDFEKAAFYASEIIQSKEYEMVENYADIFTPGNEQNSEIIFSVQYSDDLSINGTGNSAHIMFGTYDSWLGMDRSLRYNRRLNKFAESPFLIFLFGVNPADGRPLTAEITNGAEDGVAVVSLPQGSDFKFDKRFDGTFLRTILTDKAVNNYSPQVGANPVKANVKKSVKKDEIGTFFPYPNEPWSYEQIDKVNYSVINHTMYHMRTSTLWAGDARNARPLLNKFWEPGMYDDAKGQRDYFLFRKGEAYLLAAEAYLMSNQADLAADNINLLRKRAFGQSWKDAYKLRADEIDLDFVLDERGRELAGEEQRWMSLKRTGKFIERVLKYNLQAGHVNTGNISEKHYLRPLPYAWLSRLSNKVQQNPGY